MIFQQFTEITHISGKQNPSFVLTVYPKSSQSNENSQNVFNMQFNLFAMKHQPLLMLPLYRYAIEDCLFSQFALSPALFKRFVYYDYLVYHHKMKYHWKEENLIFFSKPLVRFSDHRLLDGNPNPFQDTIMTLHHQGGCIVKS